MGQNANETYFDQYSIEGMDYHDTTIPASVREGYF